MTATALPAANAASTTPMTPTLRPMTSEMNSGTSATRSPNADQPIAKGHAVKIGEMSVADVADMLRSERAQILEQTEAPLMERALAAMVSALKQGPNGGSAAEVPA